MDEIHYYRTQLEANAKREEAIAFIRDLELRLPAGMVSFDYATIFVGRTVAEVIGCVAVTIPGVNPSLTALEFDLSDEPDDYVDRLLRYRDRLIGDDG